MKAAKKGQNLFIVTFIIVLFSVGIFWGTANSFIKMQPPSDGLWTITGQELIDYDVILNGSVDIKGSGELTISNANVLFDSNSTHSLTIKVEGTLIIENSNVSVTNLDYDFTISGQGGSVISVTGSMLDNVRVSLLICDFTVESSTINNLITFNGYYLDEFIITDSTLQNSPTGINLVDCDYVTLIGNDFLSVEFGINIVTSVNATFTDNLFQDIPTEGIYVETVEVIYATNNDFINVTTGVHVKDREAQIISNRFEQNEVGIFLDNADFSIISLNNFTDIYGICLEVSLVREVVITGNRFSDSVTCIDATGSIEPYLYGNVFDNVENAFEATNCDHTLIENNDFMNIIRIGIEIHDSWYVVILENNFNNATVAINIFTGRKSIIQSNNFFQVAEGIGVISSKEIEILGNIIEETVTGIYLEQTQEAIVTANGAIKATYGLSLWSVSDVTLASNGVFDSRYGFSIWFSEGVRLLGNEVNTSEIGIIGRSSHRLQIRDGSLKALNIGIQLIGTTNPIITGNTFDEILGEAIVLKDSSGFSVYQNNFEDVGSYADIIDCLGSFYEVIDNETAYGNYYENEVGTDPVYIDTVDTIEIYDEYPLGTPYVVKPTIEFVTRDILIPTDIDDVTVETQIFVPTGVAITVNLEYIGNYEDDWTSLDITSSEDPVGQIGTINRYSGIIPAYPYDYTIIYRIKVQYIDQSETVDVLTDNSTYTVIESLETPIIIGDPEVLIEVEGEDDIVNTITTSSYYQDEKYIISVFIINRTDIGRIAGFRHVNLTWTEINTLTNETESASAIMYYNETADDNIYSFAFEQGYDAGFLLEFFISVVDTNGSFYRTVENITMIIQFPPGETGFDTITLLSIGATLLIVQALVIIRRRRKRKEE
ncbi:MAG: right-handed parallel beta-helix repeat-containing protein [Candidatus Heimdallarchaeota archaeon]|nr:right-handed parallel beta-helix repeat-containing protein [Candidatus Heimdallarchaeota archaeon]MCK4877880.1 right-handed parallel beta-helix repeat-containing protein [Candidatus Heimdallarchaeota archaeon]